MEISVNFHSMARRDLQFLCKKNGIKANLSNAAMADALASLSSVIGMEEFGRGVVESAQGSPLPRSRRVSAKSPGSILLDAQDDDEGATGLKKIMATPATSLQSTRSRVRKAATTTETSIRTERAARSTRVSRKALKEEKDDDDDDEDILETPAARRGSRTAAKKAAVLTEVETRTVRTTRQSSRRTVQSSMTVSTRRMTRAAAKMMSLDQDDEKELQQTEDAATDAKNGVLQTCPETKIAEHVSQEMNDPVEEDRTSLVPEERLENAAAMGKQAGDAEETNVEEDQTSLAPEEGLVSRCYPDKEKASTIEERDGADHNQQSAQEMNDEEEQKDDQYQQCDLHISSVLGHSNGEAEGENEVMIPGIEEDETPILSLSEVAAQSPKPAAVIDSELETSGEMMASQVETNEQDASLMPKQLAEVSDANVSRNVELSSEINEEDTVVDADGDVDEVQVEDADESSDEDESSDDDEIEDEDEDEVEDLSSHEVEDESSHGDEDEDLFGPSPDWSAVVQLKLEGAEQPSEPADEEGFDSDASGATEPIAATVEENQQPEADEEDEDSIRASTGSSSPKPLVSPASPEVGKDSVTMDVDALAESFSNATLGNPDEDKVSAEPELAVETSVKPNSPKSGEPSEKQDAVHELTVEKTKISKQDVVEATDYKNMGLNKLRKILKEKTEEQENAKREKERRKYLKQWRQEKKKLQNDAEVQQDRKREALTEKNCNIP